MTTLNVPIILWLRLDYFKSLSFSSGIRESCGGRLRNTRFSEGMLVLDGAIGILIIEVASDGGSFGGFLKNSP